jgi:hypothetical protein
MLIMVLSPHGEGPSFIGKLESRGPMLRLSFCGGAISIPAWRLPRSKARVRFTIIAAGLDVLTISRRIGHASAAITLHVYAHMFSDSSDIRAAQIMEATFANVRTE